MRNSVRTYLASFKIVKKVRRIQKLIIRTKQFGLKHSKEDRRQYFEKCRNKGVNNIPVFIISYNQLEYLEQTIKWLEKYHLTNIIIINNASTYQPLLDFYGNTKYKVIHMDRNYGHMVFWESDSLKEFRNDFYVVTDPDLKPIDECPDDFMNKFLDSLEKYPNVNKIGFSLKIDDLPETVLKPEILKVEEKFYYLKHKDLYVADIDTTFALYAPEEITNNQNFYSAFRTEYPYQVRHLPWYKNDERITEEDKYYSETKKNGAWDVYNQKRN